MARGEWHKWDCSARRELPSRLELHGRSLQRRGVEREHEEHSWQAECVHSVPRAVMVSFMKCLNNERGAETLHRSRVAL